MTARHLVLGLVAAALAVIPCRAQTMPATTQADPVRATITGVEGMVQVRDTTDAPWRRAVPGMVVAEEAEFRTGPKSAVQFVIAPNQTVALDRLGVVKLMTAVREAGVVRTKLGMPYGRTRYDIEEAGLEHVAELVSPSSTLAIRGTRVSLYDQRPFPAEAVSLTGRADFRDLRKQVAFGGKGAGKTKVNANQPNAAAVALSESFVDPTISLARTTAEAGIVDTLLSRGSTISIDREAGIRVVRGGVPPTDAQLIPNLPGYLSFVARWNTDSDLNLSVSSPGGPNNGGEALYPVGGLDTNAGGGRTAFDHRGGPNGGIEIAYFPTDHPKGLYGLGLVLVSGAPTVATVDAFRNGQRLDIFDGLTLQQTVTVPVLPPIPGISEGTAAGIVAVGTPNPFPVQQLSAARRAEPRGSERARTAPPARTAVPSQRR